MVKRFIAASLALGVTGASLLTAPSASYADQYCQCVGYVKNVLGISQAMGNAKDMIYSLPKKGFRQISSPTPGAIVIMQPNFPGSDRTYGHVGFVDSFDSRTGKITVRGANQGGKTYRDAGCTNVAVIGFRTPVVNRSDISFWVR